MPVVVPGLVAEQARVDQIDRAVDGFEPGDGSPAPSGREVLRGQLD